MLDYLNKYIVCTIKTTLNARLSTLTVKSKPDIKMAMDNPTKVI
jgi:hypothetical protein